MRVSPIRSFVLGLFLSCAATQPALRTVEPSSVVARYRGHVIRQAEVDARASEELRKLEDQIYDLRASTAERMALEALVEEAAKKDGASTDDWIDRRLSEGRTEPTEAQLTALFQRAKARLSPEVTLEDVRSQLKQVVEQEARAKRAQSLFRQLKTEAGYELVAKAPERPRRSVEAKGPERGEPKAKVTIVEFADFECPFCARAAGVVDEVLAAYPGEVRLVFRHFPLSMHARAGKAAEGAACADQQGQFWAFHDALFESQAIDPEGLKAEAQRLGLDSERFTRCLDSGDMAPLVQADLAAGQALGVTGTPAFFVNGIPLMGAQPIEAFRRLIDRELER